MDAFLAKLYTENLDSAKDDIHQKLSDILITKLEQLKARIATRVFGAGSGQLQEYMKNVTRRQGRLNFVRVRVRHGQVQRKRKYSAVKGWTLRSGKLIRMQAREKLHRRLGARRARIKRRGKRALIHRKTVIAMRKRRALGLRAWGVHPQHRR
jgi:hypothetical protein